MRGFMMFSQKSNETGHEQPKTLFKRKMIYDFMISFTICGLDHVQSTLCCFFKVLVVNLIEHYIEDC